MANPSEISGGRWLNEWRLAAWAGLAAILIAPAVIMRFSDAMAWDRHDFLFLGALLAGAAILFEVAAWKLTRPLYRLMAAGVLACVVLLIAADAAVGVF